VERLGAYRAEVLGGPPTFSSECGGPACIHNTLDCLFYDDGVAGDAVMPRWGWDGLQGEDRAREDAPDGPAGVDRVRRRA
jgi:hypothetical protein